MRYTRRQKRQEPASHIDDWLMTYADMITLLLCFFAIFVTVSIPQKEAQKAQIAKTVEQPVYPKNDVLEGNLPLYGRVQTDKIAEKTTDKVNKNDFQPVQKSSVVANAAKVPDTIIDKPLELPPVVVRGPAVPDIPQSVEENKSPAQPILPASNDAASAALSKIIETLKSQGPATIEQKGDRLTTIDISSAAFFASGSATLSDAGKSVLHEVAGTIKSEKFRDYQVTVEGHTDDAPIKTAQFPSNWELSTARASAVVHFFLEQGIPALKLRAAGYADTFPKVPNRDAGGNPIPMNQAQNRRVVIKLEKVDKKD